MPLYILIVASIISRAARFFMEAALLWKFGEPMKRVIDRNFGLIPPVVGMLGVGGFVAVRYIVSTIPFSSRAFRPLWVTRPLMSAPPTLNRLSGRRQGHQLPPGHAQLLEQLLPHHE